MSSKKSRLCLDINCFTRVWDETSDYCPYHLIDNPVLQAQSEYSEPLPPRRYEIAFEVVGELELRRVLDSVLGLGCSPIHVRLPPDHPAQQSILQIPLVQGHEKSTASQPRSRGRLAERVEDLEPQEWAKVVEILAGLFQMSGAIRANPVVRVLARLEDYLDSLDSKQTGG